MQENVFKNVICKLSAILSGPQYVSFTYLFPPLFMITFYDLSTIVLLDVTDL